MANFYCLKVNAGRPGRQISSPETLVDDQFADVDKQETSHTVAPRATALHCVVILHRSHC